MDGSVKVSSTILKTFLRARISFVTFLKTTLLTTVMWGTSTHTQAQSITFSSSNTAEDLAASVTFTAFGRHDLAITLTDTYAGNTPDQAHVLTGVYFSGASHLRPIFAAATMGSREWEGTHTSMPPELFLGGEWAYASGAGAPNGAASGIVSTSYWIPTRGNFGLLGNDGLDGTGYGLVSAGYNGSDQGGLGNNPYIQGSMIFILSGFCGNVQNITDVSFEYGTDPNPMDLPVRVAPVPEPTVLGDAGVIAAALAAWAGWRRSKPAGGMRR